MGGSTLKNVIILIASLIIGIGITLAASPLLEPAVQVDQQMQIIIAVILTIFAYISFYFMAKSGGSG